MEENDIASGGHGVSSRPMGNSSRAPVRRASPGTQGRASNSTLTPRTKSDVPARPPSAGLSGWEDDSPRSGADLLEYLGKTESADSGSSTPRQPGAITGDGNLTQALLAVRKAAEAGTSGEQSLARGPSLMSLSSSGGSYAGKSRPPGRLSRGSASTGKEDPSGQSLPGEEEEEEEEEEAEPPADEGPRTASAVETQRTVADPPRGVRVQKEASAGGHTSAGEEEDGAAGGGGDPAEAARLRGLLYSDDEDGDEDEEYQDLMTADDEALFGGVDRRSSGAGRGGEKGDSQRAAGRSNRSLAAVSSAASGAMPRLSDAGASTADVACTSNDSTSSGEADDDVESPVPCASPQAASPTPENCIPVDHLAAHLGAASTSHGSVVEPAAAATAPVLGAAATPAAAAARAPRDLVASAPTQPFASSTAAWAAQVDSPVAAPGPRGPSSRLSGGAATEALERVLSGRLSLPGGLGSKPSTPPDAAPSHPSTEAPAGGYAVSPLGMLPTTAVNAQSFPNYPGVYSLAQPQLHAHPHYQSIPTPQLGEGLRQHPPQARRLYTPGQTNRSPVRGSGYVVSPAAVRNNSSSVSPGRGLHSAVHHQAPSHHQQIARRLSSPSVPLGFHGPAGRPRSPRESHNSGASLGVPSHPHEGDDSGGPGPGLAGGVVKMGSWMSGPSAGSGHALSHSTLSRFPPAQVQHFAGGQVYRSTPISQVTGSASEEMARMLEALGAGAGAAGGAAAAAGAAPAAMGGGGGAAAAAAAAAAGGGGGGIPRGTGGSPSRPSTRGGRQPRAVAPPSSAGGGGGGGGAVAAATGYVHDRFGSYSAPARPSTSSYKAHAGAAGRSSPMRASALAGSVLPAAATAVFGNGVLSAASGEVPDAAAAAAGTGAALPRGLVVPALPQYSSALGIRHCGFKQPGAGSGNGAVANGGGGGSGGFGSLLNTPRQKPAMSATAADERMRSLTLAKMYGGGGAGGAKETQSGPAEYTVLQLLAQAPRGGSSTDGADGGGGAAEGPLSLAPPSPPELLPHTHTYTAPQRKASLPQLQESRNPQPDSIASAGPMPYGLYGHAPAYGSHPQPHLASAPGLTLYGRANAGGRISLAYEGSGLPAVQASLTAGVRSLSFDTTRRATSRA